MKIKQNLKNEKGIALITFIIILLLIIIIAILGFFLAKKSFNEKSSQTTNLSSDNAQSEESNNEDTIGYLYQNNTLKIGDKFNYSENGQDNWIIFGQDNEGNVLLTTKDAIKNKFTIDASAKGWLNYVDDLNKACSDYGTEAQNKTIESRSINMDDINRVTGFNKVLDGINFSKYTFGKNLNFDNKQVNYYYPSLEEANNSKHPYWRKSTTNSLTVSGNETPANEFYNDWYFYYKSDVDDPKEDGYNKFYYYSENNQGTEVPIENWEYVMGKSEKAENVGNIDYLVATTAVGMISPDNISELTAEEKYMKNGYAVFTTFDVSDGAVGTTAITYETTYGIPYAYGYSSTYSNVKKDNPEMSKNKEPIRPVVVIPSDIKLQSQNGIYEIAQ